MSLTKNPARQYALIAEKVVSYAELPTAVRTTIFDLPVGAVVIDGGVFVETADNGGTSCVIDVGDGDTANLFKNDHDAKTAGEASVFDQTEVGKYYTSGGHIEATRTEGGTASTAGSFRFWVVYYITNRANEVQAS